jgi:hypothetical protein
VPVCFSEKSPSFSASVRCESQSSCQHGRGFGDVVVLEGWVVMYVFSDGRGGRGKGARKYRRAYNCSVSSDTSPKAEPGGSLQRIGTKRSLHPKSTTVSAK